VPGFASVTGARIPERLSLQTLVRQPDATAIGEQAIAVGGHQVSHRPAKPDVTMEPQTAIHCVNHAVTTPGELTRDDLG
jgi:hypothetical protein